MSYKEYIKDFLNEDEIPNDQQLSKSEVNAALLAIEQLIKDKYGTAGEPTPQKRRGDEYFGLYKIYIQLANMLGQKGK